MPCPFCGSSTSDNDVLPQKNGWWYVLCGGRCGAMIRAVTDSKDQAITEWNKRARNLRSGHPNAFVSAQQIIESIWDVWYGKNRGAMNLEEFSALLSEAQTKIGRAIHYEYEKQGTAFASIAVNLRRCLPIPEQHAALIAFVDHIAAGDTVTEANGKAEKLLPVTNDVESEAS